MRPKTGIGFLVFEIDGSDDAIRAANQYYGTLKTIYSSKIFPFELPSSSFDFATCFESLEHVDKPLDFFDMLIKSIRPGGILFVSTPNEETMPLSVNSGWFKHHVKHFKPSEMLALSNERKDVEHLMVFGQKAYHINENKAVLAIDSSLDMQPREGCDDAHFIINVYRKLA